MNPLLNTAASSTITNGSGLKIVPITTADSMPPRANTKMTAYGGGGIGTEHDDDLERMVNDILKKDANNKNALNHRGNSVPATHIIHSN